MSPKILTPKPVTAPARLCLALICALLTVARVDAASSERQIWVLSNGFHSAVALRTKDVSPLIRGTIDDKRAQWVLVGWGDRDFFMADKASVWTVIKAVCWPTPSALHVVPLRQLPQRVYRNSEVILLDLSAKQHGELIAYLEAQFARSGDGRPIRLGKGFTDNSGFFLGSEKFYFPKMCNWWLADGLSRAGVPIRTRQAITAQGLTRQMRKHGNRVGGLRRPVDGF
jgi:uncharacterized protein (TIGR02117 family)